MNVRIMSALPRKNSSFFGITCGIFCRNFKEVGLGLSSPKAKVGRSNRLGRASYCVPRACRGALFKA